jgi:hypothetical protein
MDYFSEDSAHVTNGFSLNEPAASTHEDRITHKRWRPGLLCVLVLGWRDRVWCPPENNQSGGMEQHATLRTDIRSTH